MADSGEEENPETLIQWEKVRAFSPPQLSGCSLVAIRDHSPNRDESTVVFPPNDHENLHISTPPHHGLTQKVPNHNLHPITLLPYDQGSDASSVTSVSSDCFSPSDENSVPNSPMTAMVPAEVAGRGWWNFGLELLRVKVDGILVFFRGSGFFRGVYSAFMSPAATLLVFLYLLWRWRRRRSAGEYRGRSNQHLLRVINEKDKRIEKLLNQIERMNEVLLAMHRGPPSRANRS